MKKPEVIKLIKELNIPTTEMRLNTSAALVMMDILDECNDIDLDISEEEFDRLIKEKKLKVTLSNIGDNKADIGKVEIFRKNIKDIRYNIIDGITCYNVLDIVKMYKKLNRDKDKEKISIIRTHLINSTPYHKMMNKGI